MPEIKWFVLMVSVMFGAMFAGMAYEASVKAQCRASFAQSNRPAAEITAICDGRPAASAQRLQQGHHSQHSHNAETAAPTARMRANRRQA